jgi:hypothetical protein
LYNGQLPSRSTPSGETNQDADKQVKDSPAEECSCRANQKPEESSGRDRWKKLAAEEQPTEEA